MRMLIGFIYTGKVELASPNDIVPLIHAADQYGIRGAQDEFAKAAQTFIINADKTQIKFVIKLLKDAQNVNLPEIAALGFEYIDMHTMDVLESENLFEIDADLMG